MCKCGAPHASGLRKANSDKRASPFPSLGESGTAVKPGLKHGTSGGGGNFGAFCMLRSFLYVKRSFHPSHDRSTISDTRKGGEVDENARTMAGNDQSKANAVIGSSTWRVGQDDKLSSLLPLS